MYPKYYFYDENNRICLSLNELKLIDIAKKQMQQEINKCQDDILKSKLQNDLTFLNNRNHSQANKAELALAYLADENERFKKII